MAARWTVFVENERLLEEASQMQEVIRTHLCGFRVLALLEVGLLQEELEASLLMVEREEDSVLIAKMGDLQGHVKMTCLMMNSVYCPPGTFPQPTVSLPHEVLSVLQLSKLHSPLPFFL